MSSEWMKVMLDEIARKKAEAEQDRTEIEQRRTEQGAAAETSPASRSARGRSDDPA